MKILALEVTNRCNRHCRHCFRNRADPPGDLPPALAERLLLQAKTLGLAVVCLTGGEVALYPHLEWLLGKIADLGFAFTLVSNGYRFREVVLPVLLEPKVMQCLASVCLSLDGATARTHDGLRGGASFAEVGEAAAFCRTHRLPLSLKTTISSLNQHELDKLAFLGVQWGAQQHEFLFTMPTPTLIREELLPPPVEMHRIARWIKAQLAGAFTTRITVEGFAHDRVVFNCGTVMNDLNVDYHGRLILCCNLSHMTRGHGQPTQFGGEVVADLQQVSLEDGIIRQYRLAVKLIEARLKNGGNPPGLSQTPCLWCLNYFRKVDWLKDHPDLPWAAQIW
jgi:molybdenum cofactor biosynthesis enzyme MoaA